MKIGIINQKTLDFSSSQAKSSQAQPTLGNNKSGYASNIAFKAAGLSLAEDVLLKNKIKTLLNHSQLAYRHGLNVNCLL